MSDHLCVGSLGGLLADVLTVLEGEPAALGLHESAIRPLGGDLAQNRRVERAGGRLALARCPELALHRQVDNVLAAHRVAGTQGQDVGGGVEQAHGRAGGVAVRLADVCATFARVASGLGEALGVGQLPEWALQSRSVQFAAYPSQAGLAAGLLNDAVLVLQTHQPDQAKAFFREQVLAAGQEEGPVKRLVRWDENRNVAGIGAVDAFEVRVTDFPPEMFEAQMVSQLLFGRTGLRGFVYQAEDALVMTFSQQPAVLQAAVQAATAGDEAAAAEQNNLASMPAIRTMRNWMPPGRDAEFYLDIGQFSLLMQQFAESMGMADQAQVFQFDPSLPPIGFGADAVAHGIQTATIVPSGVLAGILDQLMQMQQWQEHQQPAIMQPTMR